MNEREIFSLLLTKFPSISNKIKNEIFSLYNINEFVIIDSKKIVNSISSFRKEKMEQNVFLVEQLKDVLINSIKNTKIYVKEYKKERTKLIHYQSKMYPKELLEIPDKPLLLFVKGRIPKLLKSIAIIGTREPTFYGEEIAYQLSKYLSSKGCVIISGLARGIDTKAHQGALDGGGKTIAVLGTPVNKISPKNNITLAQEISKKGAVISEFDKGRITKGEDFVRRNRITVGLAQAIIVIETRISGGTISSIRIADRLKKPIFIPKIDIWKAQTGIDKKSKQILEALELLKDGTIVLREKKQKLKTQVNEIDISNYESVLSTLNKFNEKNVREKKRQQTQSQKKITDFQ